MELQLQTDDYCIACGRDNPHGLHMEFTDEGEYYVSHWTPQPWHQGWHGIMHGGVVTMLLDEVMTWRLVSQGINAVTAEINVRLRQPTPVDQPLTIRARLVSSRRRFYETEGEILLPDGTVTAVATAKFVAS